ncbi:probable RNA polymerase II nuclear localization protein SLC7A6OS isoform X1 [Drosophila pseudoobscura]|uniref:Probable RNA polymerase II nuclear localization protein SLC7A6OS n=1 Tax=Drosophila pseudoobscura pseudoobscura TaxID=46245 RepID=A0A6I8UI36_DROPS|nr:probable RNA polymerase II nuclear localization protein SLC7A6OS isoform X1 [Drosophila pseudoobscura]
MPAVVRIKRRIDEEPHTAFVLNGKRRRLHNDENSLATAQVLSGADPTAAAADKDELTTVLKFAGTLAKQDDSATKQFAAARLNKATAKELVQQKSNDAAIASALRRDRQRQEAQQTTREQRFRVVNCLRTTLDDTNESEGAVGGSSTDEASQITILDIESQQQQQQRTETAAAGGQLAEDEQLQPGGGLQHDQQQPADSDIGYVYDLYVPENEMQAAYVDMMDDNYLSVIPMGDIILEDCYNDADEEYDSEDSNQENYYANDYPDDEEAAMGSDDDLAREMNKFVFDDDEDEDGNVTSSDSEGYNTYHDPYIHSINTSNDSFADDVDFCNTDRERGSAYERYRRRIMRELEEGLNPPSQLSPEDLDSDADDDEDSFASADDK